MFIFGKYIEKSKLAIFGFVFLLLIIISIFIFNNLQKKDDNSNTIQWASTGMSEPTSTGISEFKDIPQPENSNNTDNEVKNSMLPGTKEEIAKVQASRFHGYNQTPVALETPIVVGDAHLSIPTVYTITHLDNETSNGILLENGKELITFLHFNPTSDINNTLSFHTECYDIMSKLGAKPIQMTYIMDNEGIYGCVYTTNQGEAYGFMCIQANQDIYLIHGTYIPNQSTIKSLFTQVLRAYKQEFNKPLYEFLGFWNMPELYDVSGREMLPIFKTPVKPDTSNIPKGYDHELAQQLREQELQEQQSSQPVNKTEQQSSQPINTTEQQNNVQQENINPNQNTEQINQESGTQNNTELIDENQQNDNDIDFSTETNGADSDNELILPPEEEN